MQIEIQTLNNRDLNPFTKAQIANQTPMPEWLYLSLQCKESLRIPEPPLFLQALAPGTKAAYEVSYAA